MLHWALCALSNAYNVQWAYISEVECYDKACCATPTFENVVCGMKATFKQTFLLAVAVWSILASAVRPSTIRCCSAEQITTCKNGRTLMHFIFLNNVILLPYYLWCADKGQKLCTWWDTNYTRQCSVICSWFSSRQRQYLHRVDLMCLWANKLWK